MQLNFIVVRSAVLLAPRVHVRAFRTRRMADAGRPRTRQSLRLIEGFSEINTFLLRRLARVYMGTRPLSKGTFKDRQNAFQGTKLERLALDVSYALVTRLPHLVGIRTLCRRGTFRRHAGGGISIRGIGSCLIHSRFSFHLQFGIVICLIMRTLRDSHPPHYRSIEALGDLIDPANKVLVQCNSGCYVLDG